MKRPKLKMIRVSDETNVVVAPLHILHDPCPPNDAICLADQPTHITGIVYDIANHVGVFLLDSGSTSAGLPGTIADAIGYEHFPPAPLHPGDPPIAAKHPDRYLPLRIPGLPIKMVRFMSAAKAAGKLATLSFPLIPPKVFFPEYDVEVNARYVAFRHATLTPPMIPYTFDPKTPPWHRTADIPIIFGHSHPIAVNLDTGSTSSTVTRHTANEIGITNYPRSNPPITYDAPGYRVPVRIGPITVGMNLYVDPNGRYDIISAQELLLDGYTVTFRSEGVNIQ
jgi:hypothetical protein